MRRGPIAILLPCALLVALGVVWLVAMPRGEREAAFPITAGQRDAAGSREPVARVPADSDRVQLEGPAAVEPAGVAPPPEGAFVPGPRPRGTLRVEAVDGKDVPVAEVQRFPLPGTYALAACRRRVMEYGEPSRR